MNRGIEVVGRPEHASVPAPSLHVVHGVFSLDTGGLERLVLSLVAAGQQQGYRSSIVCIDHPGTLADAARKLGAEVYSLDAGNARGMAMARASNLLQQLQPDVLHTHQTGVLWHLGRATSPGTAIIHTEHSDHVRLARRRLDQWRNRWWWRRVRHLPAHFCCVSDEIAESAGRWGTVPAHKLSIVRNGVETRLHGYPANRSRIRAQLGLGDHHALIGTLGRLVEVKQQHLLLQAFAKLHARYPEARLLLVGDGPERAALEQRANELGIAGQTHFVGYQAESETYLAAMDVFALTSRHEGLPLALLEAWAAGLPVVSSAVGGIPLVLSHGQTGLLFPSGDEASLVAQLDALLADGELALRLGRNGRDEVRARYSIEQTAREYDLHYRSALRALGKNA